MHPEQAGYWKEAHQVLLRVFDVVVLPREASFALVDELEQSGQPVLIEGIELCHAAGNRCQETLRLTMLQLIALAENVFRHLGDLRGENKQLGSLCAFRQVEAEVNAQTSQKSD